MKNQKMKSLVAILTATMMLLAMPAQAALFIENGVVVDDANKVLYDSNFGDVVSYNGLGAAGIYKMFFTGSAFSKSGEVTNSITGPYRMFVKTEFDAVNYSELATKDFIGTVYIAADDENYKGTTLYVGHMYSGSWGEVKTFTLDDCVGKKLLHTDRMTKLDYVLTYDSTKGNYRYQIYLNNTLYTDNKSSKTGSFNKFVISMQTDKDFTTPAAVNLFAGDISFRKAERTATAAYVPNNGTGEITSTGALADYAANFTPGSNFYVPADTTVADILKMNSTYKRFELRDEAGNVLSDKTSTASAIGCYIYCVGQNNNTNDNGLYSKVCETDLTLKTNASSRTFTATGYTCAENKGVMLIAQYDSEGKVLKNVLDMINISDFLTDETYSKTDKWFTYTYTVENYDANSKYKAFYWQLPSLTPLAGSKGF